MLVFEDKVHEGRGLPPLHNINTIIPVTESGANKYVIGRTSASEQELQRLSVA